MTRYVVYRYLVMYTNLKKTSSRNFPTSDLAGPLPPLSSDFIGFGLTPPPPKKSDVVCGCSLIANHIMETIENLLANCGFLPSNCDGCN